MKRFKSPPTDRRMSRLKKQTLTWDGLSRSYLEFVPPICLDGRKVPLVICLHGRSCTALDGFEGQAFLFLCTLMGWIAISPQGMKDKFGITGWNAGIRHVAFGFHFDVLKNIDDVGFINAIIDEMSNRYNIDSQRIFVLGFSMGGFMAHRLAIECGSRFRAVCSVNGTIGNLIQDMLPKNPVNILHIHGTNDTSVPYDPSPQSHPHGIGAEQTFEFWRKCNGSIGEPDIWHYPKLVDDGISFERYSYTHGTHGAVTEMIKAVNGSHTWYDHFKYDIDYSIEITSFFETVPLLTE